MKRIRTLVLSGGGGRGAFHAGVYKFLTEAGKTGLDKDHSGVWDPQVVVGTSIGAVNGAAIVQGISAEALETIWLGLREHDIQGLPPGMQFVSRWIARRAFREIIGVRLPRVPSDLATSPAPDHFWPPLPLLPKWLGERLIGRWINLLDTGPLKRTLQDRMHFDAQRIAESQKTLLIAATKVQTGERVIFCNRQLLHRQTGETRQDVVAGITLDRVLASCSIPLVYPWTYDPETKAHYWDGAVVANTPLGAALDAVWEEPIEAPVEVVVVLMTPWWPSDGDVPPMARELPESFGDALTWTLDWALLASFRERLRLINAYNRFAEQERAEGRKPYRYRQVKVVVVAPDDFLPAARILDYDEVSGPLIEMGYQAARKAFVEHFGDNH
ncbi:MAG: patatin-like phospholipase family protein [Anaerolineales bacterium]|nr:patatin-like phospholipase family protein [Anaerolineales bacterium]